MPQYIDLNSYFRAMIPDTAGFPQIGRNASMLGVRVPEDIVVDEKGRVKPGTGGMSVAPNSMLHVPPHRRPRGMGMGSTGRKENCMYALAKSAIPADRLRVRLDPRKPLKHAFVEPAILIELEKYESDLAGTQKEWRQVWP